jgi:hypothetical protein
MTLVKTLAMVPPLPTVFRKVPAPQELMVIPAVSSRAIAVIVVAIFLIMFMC